MPITIPQSPERREVLRVITAAGPAGLTRAQVVAATALPAKTVAMFMRNLTAAGDTFAGQRTPETGRYHPYVAAEHYGAHCKLNGLPVPPELAGILAERAEHRAAAQRAPNLPGRGHSVTAIKKAPTPLPVMGSPHRAAVIKALAAAPAPLTTGQLAMAAAVTINTTRRVLDALLREGRAQNVGTPLRRLWAKATPGQRPASRTYGNLRVCNSSMPTMDARHMPTMTCARADAEQHLAAPSRRADERKPYRAPALIGSSLGGGV